MQYTLVFTKAVGDVTRIFFKRIQNERGDFMGEHVFVSYSMCSISNSVSVVSLKVMCGPNSATIGLGDSHVTCRV